jgi:trehalose/maltose transport system substrate-binding protein
MNDGLKYLVVGMSSAAAMAATAQASEVSIFCSSAGVELELCETASNAWAEETGHTVKINKMPASWGEALPLYQQLLAGKSGDIDLMTLDNIWVGALAPHLLNLRDYVDEAELNTHFESALSDATIDGKLLAMPWYIDAGMMFYRKDLLEQHGKQVPSTWQELTETAAFVQAAERDAGNDDMWGYSWQARAYEGLTCDGLELVSSFGGGTFISPEGDVTINNEKAIAALDLAASWIGTISPEGVLNYDEESSRGVFETGNAVFHRNWSYVWGTSQEDGSELQGKVGVMALPVGAEGEKSSGCYGAGMLGVSKYSEDPEAAASLAVYLTTAVEQKRRAMEAYSPTVESLYSDVEVLESNPFLKDAEQAYADSASRPSQATGSSYNRASQRIYNAIHNILSGKVTAAEGVAAAEADLEKIKKRGWK